MSRDLVETGHARAGRLASGLTTADRLLVAYCGFLTLAAWMRHPRPGPIVAALAALALGHLALASAAPRSATARLAHDFFPALSLAALFGISGPVIAVTNALRFDDVMAAADLRLLGPVAEGWRQLLGRPAWLVDLASLAYVSYYPLPLGIGIAVYASHRRREYDDVVLAVVTTLVLCYLGYFLFPTTGPRVPAGLEDAVLGGGAVSRGVRAFVATAEANLLDAFPSGHTAIALVSLGVGWRSLPRARPLLLLVAAGIVFATVYLSYHYVVDVLAGAALALAVPHLTPWLRRALGPQAPATAAGEIAGSERAA